MKEFFKTLAGLEIDLPYSGRVDGLRAQLIWQFLRFNKKYRTSYDKLKVDAANDDSGELPMFFANAWCLSTTVDYQLEVLPHERDDDGTDLSPCFEYKAVRPLPKWKYLQDWGDILLPDEQPVFVLNPFASQDQVMRFLTSQEPTSSESAMRSLRQAQLVEYIVCHHYLKTLGMMPTEFSPIFHDIFATGRSDTLQSASLKGKVDGFDEITALAPWCFFTPPHR
ncbi:MAG: hypothetical protein K2Q26_03630 [Bdellovibrionales bacterium]|nr:hypothetical protein [Bdellovibrionales bacterium]